MAASVVLSIFVLGIGSFYYSASNRANDVILRQKAIFALNAEMERLSAMYVHTNFGVAGPSSTDTYESAPTTRLIYPADVSGYMGGAGNNFATGTAATFTAGADFLVWRKAGGASNLDRAYVWIDRERNVLGRVSWTATNIVVNACWGDDDDCECLGYSGVFGSEDWCREVVLYMEYPYYFKTPDTVIAPAQRRTITLKTIVGRV
jgi:hypothetical protein